MNVSEFIYREEISPEYKTFYDHQILVFLGLPAVSMPLDENNWDALVASWVFRNQVNCLTWGYRRRVIIYQDTLKNQEKNPNV